MTGLPSRLSAASPRAYGCICGLVGDLCPWALHRCNSYSDYSHCFGAEARVVPYGMAGWQTAVQPAQPPCNVEFGQSRTPWQMESTKTLTFAEPRQDQEGHGRHQLRLWDLRVRGNAKINRTVDRPQSLVPGRPATKASEPPTKTFLKSSANAQNNQSNLLTEQTLRKQIRAAKDDPVLTEILEAALTMLCRSMDKQQVLPLKDQRAKLMAEAKQLAEKVDKQTQVVAGSRYQSRCQGNRSSGTKQGEQSFACQGNRQQRKKGSLEELDHVSGTETQQEEQASLPEDEHMRRMMREANEEPCNRPTAWRGGRRKAYGHRRSEKIECIHE
eukprot:1500638-Amphidinium_carterae.2